jgi:hypothetical protein
MAQQTAVEWLEEQFLRERFVYDFDFDKAKEMEKEQIIKAVDVGFDEGCKFPEDIKLGSGDQYYTQTYGK